MHHSQDPLVLLNVWDVASARIAEESGFPALATTSAGIAFARGYPDGQKIPREEMLAAISRIACAVRVPVTADMEAGYGNRPEDVASTARAVLEAGAVGLNLEDATGDPAHPLVDLASQLEKIHAVRETAASLNVPLVLNARTDVWSGDGGMTNRNICARILLRNPNNHKNSTRPYVRWATEIQSGVPSTLRTGQGSAAVRIS